MNEEFKLENRFIISPTLMLNCVNYTSPQKYHGPRVDSKHYQDNRRRMKRTHSSGKVNYGK